MAIAVMIPVKPALARKMMTERDRLMTVVRYFFLLME